MPGGGVAKFLLPALLQKALPLLTLPIFTALMAPAQYGQAMVLVTGFMLGTVLASFGQDTVLYHDAGTLSGGERVHGLRSSAILTLFLTSTVSAFFSVAVFFSRLSIFGIGSDVLATELVAIAIYCIGFVPAVALYRIERMALRFALVQLGFVFSQLAVRLCLILSMDNSLLAWAIADVAAAAVAAVLGFPILRRNMNLGHLSSRLLAKGIRMGGPMVPSKLAQWIGSLSDRLIISAKAGVAAGGVYSLGSQISFSASSIIVEICRYFLPEYAACVSQGKRAALARVFAIELGLISLISSAVGVVGPSVVVLLFPSEYSRAASVAVILSFAVVLNGIQFVVVDFVSVGLGETGRIWVFTTIGAGFSIIGNLVLVPIIGLEGGAWTSVATAGVVLMMVGWKYRRELSFFGFIRRKTVLILSLNSIIVFGSVVIRRFDTGVGLELVALVALAAVGWWGVRSDVSAHKSSSLRVADAIDSAPNFLIPPQTIEVRKS
ncbi:lipopolysaccharide biosynthesis protein [Rhodococcus sp. NCIMB 12038]|uniref:lipopolysaccharide biosynthesis protein n=1 Tax=Rhodococcus sp. NCIMB 12038 TaxID=933800 RepID=UPI00211AE102|nr:lipopolysaccharide biosynthesis protein [Rhodococcus sp. NCIMB 12038]